MLPVKHMVVNGVRTVVHDSDPLASQEAVVFVHGSPGPMDDWEELAPATAAIVRTIAMTSIESPACYPSTVIHAITFAPACVRSTLIHPAESR